MSGLALFFRCGIKRGSTYRKVLFIGLVMIAAGCQSAPKIDVPIVNNEELERRLPVIGQWSAQHAWNPFAIRHWLDTGVPEIEIFSALQEHDVRYRLLTESRDMAEMGVIHAALEVRNFGDKPVDLSRQTYGTERDYLSFPGPFGAIFLLDSRILTPEMAGPPPFRVAAKVAKVWFPGPLSLRLRLEPGQCALLAEEILPVGPAKQAPLAGSLTAVVDSFGELIAAPPIQLRVKQEQVEWGATVNGLRMHIQRTVEPPQVPFILGRTKLIWNTQAGDRPLRPGDKLQVAVSVENMGDADAEVFAQWQPHTERSGNEIYAYITTPTPSEPCPIGQPLLPWPIIRAGTFSTGTIPIPVQEPGTYRLRVILDCSNPLPNTPSNAWRGKLVSNEIAFTVSQPEKKKD
jgi:hypothetical protein